MAIRPRSWTWAIYTDDPRPTEIATSRHAAEADRIRSDTVDAAIIEFVAVARQHGVIVRMEVLPDLSSGWGGRSARNLRAWVTPSPSDAERDEAA